MATFSIGSSGSNLELNTPQYIGTLDANTYPSGTLTFNDLKSGGAYWNHNSTNAEWFAVYLTNETHTIWSNQLFEMYCNGSLDSTQLFANKSVSVSFPDANIVGQPLYLIAYRWNGTSYGDLSSPAFRLRNYTSITLGVANWYTYASAPTIIGIERSGAKKLKITWDGSVAGAHSSINGYDVYLSKSQGGSAVSGLSGSVSTTTTYGSYEFTVSDNATYYGHVRTKTTSGYHSAYGYSAGMGAATSCTAPTSVSGTVSGTSVSISWSGAGAGWNNSISSYGVLRNTSQTHANATTISAGTSSTSISDAPGSGTFYYGVRTQGSAGSNFYSGFKWSSAVTVGGKPKVNAGDPVTKSNMDNLKVYLGQGNTVTAGSRINASDGNTYRANTLTAGSTKINASWFNA